MVQFSMATVCGATMALMDAGVPMKDMVVGGIAMGLLQGSNGNSMQSLILLALKML